MAGISTGPSSLDGLSSCPICFEDYEVQGDFIPRLLPCTHTLCQKCLQELLVDKSLQCPECRKRHPADSGIRSFPQNKYILSTIKRQEAIEKEPTFEVCEQHGRELILFCTEVFCQNAICSLCLSVYHRGHEVVDLQQLKEEKHKTLTTGITSLMEDLNINKEKMLALKAGFQKSGNACVTKIERNKAKTLKIVL